MVTNCTPRRMRAATPVEVPSRVIWSAASAPARTITSLAPTPASASSATAASAAFASPMTLSVHPAGYPMKRRLIAPCGVGDDRLRDHLDREVRAVPLAQAAEDAVLLFDDRVIAEHQRVLRADLDADVAALAEDRVPADVRVVDPANPVAMIIGYPRTEADGGIGAQDRQLSTHGRPMIDPESSRRAG